MTHPDLSIAVLRERYATGDLTPTALVEQLLPALEAGDEHRAWITRLSRDQLLTYAHAIEGRDRTALPLYGIPFAIKDNIDLAGIPTTAGCAEFAYTPERHSTVVQRLVDAGAIPIGKTNLDQENFYLTSYFWRACK